MKTKATDDTPPTALEQPRTGGSFVRQDDGTLKMVEGAIDLTDAEAATDPAPDADPASGVQPPVDPDAPANQNNEG